MDVIQRSNVDPGCAAACLQAEKYIRMHCGTLTNMRQRLTRKKFKLLNEVVVFLYKKRSRSFLTIRLNHRCPIDYFNNVLITLGLERGSCIAV